MKKITFLLSSALCLSSFIGISQTIVNTNASNKHVIFEEFTGVKCGNCPAGHTEAANIASANPGTVHIIAYGPSNSSYTDPTGTNGTDFRRPFANAFYTASYCSPQSGSRFMPSAFINRKLIGGNILQSRSGGVWTNNANSTLTESSPMNVGIKSTYNSSAQTLTIDVEVADSELCPRYTGLTISDIKVAESPEWLRRRLETLGINPINNVVDITNYVLHETGNPLHAFDAAMIKGNKITVKTTAQDTKFISLDEVERKLNAEDLMICNSEDAMCIAGVFGGLESGVNSNTTSIFLEAAYFNPIYVRKTAKRHALNTDASFRFERSVNPNTVVWALKRAALLIKEIAGGTISSEIVDLYPNPIEHFKVDFSYDKCDRLIGEALNRDTIKEILSNLEIDILEESDEKLLLSVPPYRADVQREVDVIEEILRIYGYNNIGMTGRINASLSINPKPDAHKVQERISELLTSNGFHEGMSNSLTKSSYTDGLDCFKKEAQVVLLNPLSQDLSAMRQTLLFGGLESLAYNINRKVSDVLLYEYGKTYNKFGDDYHEERRLALWVSGKKQGASWSSSKDKVDFFYLKGIVEKLLQRLGLHKGVTFSAIQTDLFSEGLAYKIRKKKVLEIGNVRSSILKSSGIKQEVFYADLNWDAILELLKDQKTKYKEVSKFPEVRRDLALLVDNEVLFSDLQSIALRTDKNLLKEVSLFDVYQGDKVAEGKKSYALGFLFRDEEKTLTDKVVDKAILKIFKSLEHQLKAELRDGAL